MIEVPVWAAVLVLGLLPVVGLGCYWYGWKLRSSLDERVIRVETIDPRTTITWQRFVAAATARFNAGVAEPGDERAFEQ